jgi:hypothetical protein
MILPLQYHVVTLRRCSMMSRRPSERPQGDSVQQFRRTAARDLF